MGAAQQPVSTMGASSPTSQLSNIRFGPTGAGRSLICIRPQSLRWPIFAQYDIFVVWTYHGKGRNQLDAAKAYLVQTRAILQTRWKNRFILVQICDTAQRAVSWTPIVDSICPCGCRFAAPYVALSFAHMIFRFEPSRALFTGRFCLLVEFQSERNP